jgi:hypothetical protein
MQYFINTSIASTVKQCDKHRRFKEKQGATHADNSAVWKQSSLHYRISKAYRNKSLGKTLR